MTVNLPSTTCRQVMTSWGVTATPEPQTDPLSTRHTVGYFATLDSWIMVDMQRLDCTGLGQTSQNKPWRLPQRMMFLNIDWTEQTRVNPIHSFAFQQNEDTMTPIRCTLVLFTTNTPPPSVPGKHLASVSMMTLSSPVRLLTIPLLRVLMNRSRQREPKGEPQARTVSPFWREEQLCQGIDSDLRPSTFSHVLRIANQLRNRASLISSLSSSSPWKRQWSASWKSVWNASSNSEHLKSATNWAETSLLWAGLLTGGYISLRWFTSGKVTWILSFLLKLRGDKKCSAENWSGSVIKRENGRPVHMMVPVWGWTTTPLQLWVEKASFKVTTQQHFSTSFNSMPDKRNELYPFDTSSKHWTVVVKHHIKYICENNAVVILNAGLRN